MTKGFYNNIVCIHFYIVINKRVTWNLCNIAKNWNHRNHQRFKTDTVKKTDKKPINISFKTILIYEILTCNIIQFDYFFPNKEITLIVWRRKTYLKVIWIEGKIISGYRYSWQLLSAISELSYLLREDNHSVKTN
jgi:hypothetical protein